MKSCNAQTKVRKLARVGMLSLLALMILTLSTGRAIAGVEDFKLWKRVEGKQIALEYLKEEKDIKQSVEWLSTKTEEGSFKEFIKANHSQPFKFAQGVFKAAQDAITKGKFKEFRTAFLKNMETVKGADFWGKNTKGFEQEAALKRMLGKIFRGDKAVLTDVELAELSNKLKSQDEESFLKDAFAEASLRADLALEDTKDADKPPEDPARAAFDQRIADILKRLEGIEGRVAGSTAPGGTTPPGGATPPGGPVPPTGGNPPGGATPPVVRGGGEQPSFDENAAIQKCREVVDAFRRNTVAPIQDMLKALAAQVGLGNQRPPRRNDDRGDDDLGKLLASGVADAFGNKNNNVVPPPTAQQQFARTNDSGNKNNGIFDAPIPEKQQQEEQQLGPLNFGPAQNSSQPIEVSLDIPTYIGKSELADARQVLREVDPNSRTSPAKSLGQNSSLRSMLVAKNKLASEKKRASVAASNAREAADQLQQQLETMSKGAESRLSSTTKRRRDELAQEIERKKQEIETQKQQAPMVGNNIEARQALSSTVAGLTQEMQAKQQELNTLNNTIKSEIESGDAQIKGLASRFQQLNSIATKIEGAASEINGEYELVAEMAEQRKNYEDQLAMGPQVQPGVRNVYSGIPSGGNRSTPPPRGVTAGKNPQLQTGVGPEQRKPLSGVK